MCGIVATSSQVRPIRPRGQRFAADLDRTQRPVARQVEVEPHGSSGTGGKLYLFFDEDSHLPESEGVHILRLPKHNAELSPILHVVPLQLLSYHAALVKGRDVAKPQNLAKSVTEE